ncbi:MAG: energy-converting hydrogenase B subunit EhbP [Candidatus Methanomethyliaceae archaeon]|nr:energy-converting hydrogenase B subunit EhbP [Candidatus Methanomethyliaceae archaeon]MDW7970924.1 energy-converting hydrogenase B subunit EhbP [Nitrososphaerota archaeon]
MPKIVIREKHVINLGGWVVENRANLPYKDYVIGNPFNEPVKIEAPIYSMEDIEAIKKLGLIVEPVLPYENLVEKINKVKRLIGL